MEQLDQHWYFCQYLLELDPSKKYYDTFHNKWVIVMNIAKGADRNYLQIVEKINNTAFKDLQGMINELETLYRLYPYISLNDAILHLKKVQAELVKEHEEKNKEHEENNKKPAELIKELEEMKQEQERAKESFKYTVFTLKEDYDQLEKDKDRLKNMNDMLDERNTELEETKLELEEQIAELQRKYESAQRINDIFMDITADLSMRNTPRPFIYFNKDDRTYYDKCIKAFRRLEKVLLIAYNQSGDNEVKLLIAAVLRIRIRPSTSIQMTQEFYSEMRALLNQIISQSNIQGLEEALHECDKAFEV